MKKFSERLEWLLKERGKRLSDVARSTGIDKGYLSNLRSGKRENPSQRTLDALATFFSCDPQWLRTGAGQPELSREVVSAKIMEQLEAGPAGAAQSMDVAGLIDEIRRNVDLLEREEREYLKGAYAKIIADFAKELQRKTGWLDLVNLEARTGGVKY